VWRGFVRLCHRPSLSVHLPTAWWHPTLVHCFWTAASKIFLRCLEQVKITWGQVWTIWWMTCASAMCKQSLLSGWPKYNFKQIREQMFTVHIHFFKQTCFIHKTNKSCFCSVTQRHKLSQGCWYACTELHSVRCLAVAVIIIFLYFLQVEILCI